MADHVGFLPWHLANSLDFDCTRTRLNLRENVNLVAHNLKECLKNVVMQVNGCTSPQTIHLHRLFYNQFSHMEFSEWKKIWISFKNLTGKPTGNRLLGMPRRRRKTIFQYNFQKQVSICATGLIELGIGIIGEALRMRHWTSLRLEVGYLVNNINRKYT